MSERKNDRPRPEKKSETLEVRLPYSVKRAFMQAAHRNGETASSLVREFIDTYLEEARQAERKTILQEMMMTIDQNRRKTTTLLAGFIVTAFTFAAMPSAADNAAFNRLDKNGDGVITSGEIGADDSFVIRALDADNSGGITADEFPEKTSIIKIDHDDMEAVPVGAVRIIKIPKADLDFSDPERVETAIRRALSEHMGDPAELEKQELVDKPIEQLDQTD